MNIFEYQKWVAKFYKERGWEVSKAIRTIEIGRDRPDEVTLSKEIQIENLKEELGNVLDNLFILTEIMSSHKDKRTKRYQ